MDEIPLERLEYRLDLDDWIDSRFIALGWMVFKGWRRDLLVDLRRTGLLVLVYERRLFGFFVGDIWTDLSSAMTSSRSGTKPRTGEPRLGERGGMTGSGIEKLMGCSCLSKEDTFQAGPSSSLGRSDAGEIGLIQSSELSSREALSDMAGWQLGTSGLTGRGGAGLVLVGPSSTVGELFLRRQQQKRISRLRITTTGTTTEIAITPAFLWFGLPDSLVNGSVGFECVSDSLRTSSTKSLVSSVDPWCAVRGMVNFLGSISFGTCPKSVLLSGK
jgi:hypothetical protein